MRITFLGTGTSQGVPVIGCNCEVCCSLDYKDKRLRTSIHLIIDGKSFIIDSGPDFRQQVLQNRIHDLDALLFTHEHKDHISGMDDVRGFNYKHEKPIPVYASQKVINQLKMEYAYIFEDQQYPGIPQIEINAIENKPFQVEGITFNPVEVMHYKLPVFGFRIGRFAYITDASYISENEIRKLDNLDFLVLNALQKETHISHFNLEEAVNMVKKINPKVAYFTHISHTMGLHQEVSKELPHQIHLAYDGLSLKI